MGKPRLNWGKGRFKHRCIEYKFYIKPYNKSPFSHCLKFNKRPKSSTKWFNCNNFEKKSMEVNNGK